MPSTEVKDASSLGSALILRGSGEGIKRSKDAGKRGLRNKQNTLKIREEQGHLRGEKKKKKSSEKRKIALFITLNPQTTAGPAISSEEPEFSQGSASQLLLEATFLPARAAHGHE